jgi:uncharacterized protein YecE (DUF72 family)
MGICIGTSGWHYADWKGAFYPRRLNSAELLSYYAAHFDCVEVNNSFYRLPTDDTVAQWRSQVPPRFSFSLKASRYITHMKKLKDAAEPLSAFLRVANLFGDQLGTVLFQLPPHWKVNIERLAAFIALLPGDRHFAFEFRDPSWHTQEVTELLCQHNVAFCQFDLDGFTSAPIVTGDRVYVRLHGPQQAYSGSYSKAALEAWADRLQAWQAQGRDVLVFFDNDHRGQAVHDANRLYELVCA